MKWLLVGLMFAGCGGEAPLDSTQVVEVVEDMRPAWCSPDAGVIEGWWGREFVHRDHNYQSNVRFTEEDHCTYSYRLEHWLAETEHDTTLVFLTTGVVVVTDVEWAGEIATVKAEANMTYRGQAPTQTGGEGWTEDFDNVLYTPKDFKIWGNRAVFWDQQFSR